MSQYIGGGRLYFKGLRFGMLLQLAIGPVCIFIFNLASNNGFVNAWAGVTAVTLIDATYVTMAVLGITAFIRNQSSQKIFKVLGSMIVAYFGFSIVLSVFEINILPRINLFTGNKTGGSFIQALLLTASNPLTILFFVGVFSAKITEANMDKKSIKIFAAGTVSATFLFMTAIALIGAVTHKFTPAFVINILNVSVGLALIYFAVKKLLYRQPS